MIAEASVPAKIILCGEHAVVYGQPAIAIPIHSLRAKAVAYAPDSAGQGLRIRAIDLNREFSLLNPANYANSNPLLLAAGQFMKQLKLSPPDMTIELRSDIPVASGLGSGAATTTAFLRVLGAALSCSVSNDVLNAMVYEVEKVYHGTPSGIDNTVIVYERPVYFVRNQPIEWPAVGTSFTFLVADTGVSAPTHIAVADVRKLYGTSHSDTQLVIDSIGQVVIAIRQAIESGDVDKLGSLMVENHRLLQRLTVSSVDLDTLVDAALAAGAVGAKLSGGGRGGNMIALVSADHVDDVKGALLGAGAVRVIEVSLS